MIDATIRLRRAVHLNDLVLVKRIIKNNPHVLQNPDLADSANTSLHLAAQLGLLEVVVRFDPSPSFLPPLVSLSHTGGPSPASHNAHVFFTPLRF